MKLFRVSFPDILVAGHSEQDAEDQVWSSLSDTEYWSDFSHLELLEITNKQQIDDFEEGYIPYAQSNSELKARDFLRMREVLDKLTESELELIKKVYG